MISSQGRIQTKSHTGYRIGHLKNVAQKNLTLLFLRYCSNYVFKVESKCKLDQCDS